MRRETPCGQVILVGAGPGAADLLTVRADRLIRSAQALLFDALVGEDIVALAPKGCVRLRTGKRAGGASMAQDTINRLMVKLARRGLTVVRLKGGDPAVFGRLGEESAYLSAHGIRFEIVPGVTAVSAAAAQFQFPLTHRGEARHLLISTASLAKDAQEGVLPETASDPQATLALYMARDRLTDVVSELLRRGRSPETPAMAVESAGTPKARLIKSTLMGLTGAIATLELKGPVLIVIGAVVSQARPESIDSLASAVAPRSLSA